jgi:hypothetical protein
MCEVRKGMDGEIHYKIHGDEWHKEGARDQGTSEYLQSDIKDESIYRPIP